MRSDAGGGGWGKAAGRSSKCGVGGSEEFALVLRTDEIRGGGGEGGVGELLPNEEKKSELRDGGAGGWEAGGGVMQAMGDLKISFLLLPFCGDFASSSPPCRMAVDVGAVESNKEVASCADLDVDCASLGAACNSNAEAPESGGVSGKSPESKF